MNPNLFWKDPGVTRRYRTAVSLHGHTLYSRETLAFIPRIARHVPFLQRELERQRRRFRADNGRSLDFERSWWTPPLALLAAMEVERHQIVDRLELNPPVSLTDHDTIEGVVQLQVLGPPQRSPISVEWTMPIGPAFLHVGLHHLPPESADQMMRAMAAYTADPRVEELAGLLEWLSASPSTLVVINHPYWDEADIGQESHGAMAWDFVRRYGQWIHAAELNGLRPWKENREVIRFAAAAGLPLISGGDRHAREPNTCLNLTNAETFEEFVTEVRGGFSEILFMPRYRQPHEWRVMQNLLAIIGEAPDHPFGWRRWCDRCFYLTQSGVARPLGEIWPDGGPLWVRAFIGLTELGRHPQLQPALRRAFGTSGECVL